MRRLLLTLIMLTGAAPLPAETPPLPDPTRPPDLHMAPIEPITLEDFQQFSLSAIKIGPDRRAAIINGRIVGPGDLVGAATVIEIQPTGVVLDYREQRLELSLLAHRVKHDAPEP